jgi:hypothetical protein
MKLTMPEQRTSGGTIKQGGDGTPPAPSSASSNTRDPPAAVIGI